MAFSGNGIHWARKKARAGSNLIFWDMKPVVHDFVRFVENNKGINTKEEMIQAACGNFALQKRGRALYYTDSFAVVFCYSKNGAFSNVVLSLSMLRRYDHVPCFVVLVKKGLDNVIHLMNTTFLEKISHSSQNLRADNIRGSFLGSNIRKEFEEINKTNRPEDFDELFSYHEGFTWQENLERLVESTNNIKPSKVKVVLDESEFANLLSAPERTMAFIGSGEYDMLLQDLRQRCEGVKDAILRASRIDNVNVRGRFIEVLITCDKDEREYLLDNIDDIEHILPSYDTKNGLADYVRNFGEFEVFTDIKTKLLCLDSNPKAYNIDKFLKCMGRDKAVFMFFIVGIGETDINTILVSPFHNELQNTTLLQHHWAGRGVRGVAQFNGRTMNELLKEERFTNRIDEVDSRRFIKVLLDR